MEITISERLAALKSLDMLRAELDNELQTDEISETRIDASGPIKETGTIDRDGSLKRPWCPETRILEHREAVGYLLY